VSESPLEPDDNLLACCVSVSVGHCCSGSTRLPTGTKKYKKQLSASFAPRAFRPLTTASRI
jgi:hypothetical protein